MGRTSTLVIRPVTTLYGGPYRTSLFEDLARALDRSRQEGFVARIADSFAESDMPRRVGKYVREGHVQSDIHWMKAELIPNRLAEG